MESEAGFAFSDGRSPRAAFGAISLVTKVKNPIKAAVQMAKVRYGGNDSIGRIPPVLLAGNYFYSRFS